MVKNDNAIARFLGHPIEIVLEPLYWGIDYDTITLYNAEYTPILEMGWDVAEDFSTLYLDMEG